MKKDRRQSVLGNQGNTNRNAVEAAKPPQIPPQGRRRGRRRRIRRGAVARLGRRSRQHRRALSDHRQHGADRRRLRRGRQARGRDGQRGRRHQVARRRQAQPDHLRRAERHHGDAHRNRPADQRQQIVGDPRLFRQRADADRERGGRTRQGAADHRIELGPAQQGPNLHLHAVCARLAVRPGAVADVETGQRQAEGRGDLREYRVRHLDLERLEGTGARPKASRS